MSVTGTRIDNLEMIVKTSDNNSTRWAIVGGGMLGMTLAYRMATMGHRVTLIEATSAIGGTVAHALIHTLGGIFDLNERRTNEGLVGELVERIAQASSLARLRRIGKTKCWTALMRSSLKN